MELFFRVLWVSLFRIGMIFLSVNIWVLMSGTTLPMGYLYVLACYFTLCEMSAAWAKRKLFLTPPENVVEEDK